MEKVWLSTNYYLDPRVLGLSEGAEVLFLRTIAYCGAADTFGIITETALKTLGIRALNRKKSELLSSGLMREIEPGKFELSGWAHWQKNGDDLVKRRLADKARKAKQRAKEAEMSRDSHTMSRGESREEKRREDTYVPTNASHVSNAEAPEGEQPSGPKVPADGWSMVRDVPGLKPMPQATKTALAIQAAQLLHAGSEGRHIRAALDLWLTKPDAGPGLLPHLVADVIKSETTPVGGSPASSHDAKVLGYLEAGRRLTGQVRPQSDAIQFNSRKELA